VPSASRSLSGRPAALSRHRPGELSARERPGAFLDRVHRVSPRLNAIVTLAEERAAAGAAATDEAAARGGLGVPRGLPVAVQDLIADSLPAGLQLAGRYGSDDRLLSIAGAVAEALLPEPARLVCHLTSAIVDPLLGRRLRVARSDAHRPSADSAAGPRNRGHLLPHRIIGARLEGCAHSRRSAWSAA